VARVVLARRARGELLELNWPLIDAIEDALGVLERERRRANKVQTCLAPLHARRNGRWWPIMAV
jgi:hypothetical protein